MILKNKVVVITGASEGLGKVLEDKISALGAKVAPVSRHNSAFTCDISNLSDVQKTVNAIFKQFKTIDVLINNAAVWTDDEIEKKNPKKRAIALNTNVLGTIQFTETILPILRKRNNGHIFNVISTSGTIDSMHSTNKLWKTYGATKWALSGYTKALRESVSDTKIKVTGFFPGGFDSNFYENGGRKNTQKQPWMMKIEDVADIVLFALTRPSDVLIESVTVTKVF